MAESEDTMEKEEKEEQGVVTFEDLDDTELELVVGGGEMPGVVRGLLCGAIT